MHYLIIHHIICSGPISTDSFILPGKAVVKQVLVSVPVLLPIVWNMDLVMGVIRDSIYQVLTKTHDKLGTTWLDAIHEHKP